MSPQPRPGLQRKRSHPDLGVRYIDMAGPALPTVPNSSSPATLDTASPVEPYLYNGVSKRERGWKSKIGEFMEGRMPQSSKVKRWDGAARACIPWDSLRRDSELWYKNGNCLVHLYRKGQSRRGPAFKVPFSDLLAAKCYPLVEKFLLWDDIMVPNPNIGPERLEDWSLYNPRARVDLYIPPPRNASKEESVEFHLAIRNLFAWVFRRSMVGELLGNALAGLLTKMDEFRSPGADNVADLFSYMDEEGYMSMKNQPIHALGMLHLAEQCQFRDLYIDAFTHCAGMSDYLFTSPEYQHMSSVTRKLLGRAKVEMDLKLGRSGLMLRNFLTDDLSEAHIGLTEGGRAHLERFRSFLLAFYSARLGYYPPTSTDRRSLIFERDVYELMRDDFKALYEYLADSNFASGNSSILAQGGICSLQSVHGFDLRNKLDSLPHPLPLLPEMTPPAKARRLSWLSRAEKVGADRRIAAHAALVKATNHTDLAVMNNELVIAYRRFEEESVCSPLKIDKQEKLSHVDARKIRWILIYAIYQVLRSCTEAPLECQDTKGVQYNVAINATNLPPWEEDQWPIWRGSNISRCNISRQPSFENSLSLYKSPSTSSPALPLSRASTPSTLSILEIKPDIDYFALTHPVEEPQRPKTSATMKSTGAKSEGPPVRLRSLQGSIRRSFSLFRHSQVYAEPMPVMPNPNPVRRQSYHEILVHGYGNGTNDVQFDSLELKPGPLTIDTSVMGLSAQGGATLTNRSHSTSSASSSSTASSGNSSAISQSTAASVFTTAHIEAVSCVPDVPEVPEIPPLETLSVSMLRPVDKPLPRRPSVISALTATSSLYSSQNNTDDEAESDVPPMVPRRSSMRRRRSSLAPSPLRIRKASTISAPVAEVPDFVSSDDEDGEDMVYIASQYIQEVQDVWDQFADVGGLTEPVAGGVTGRWSPY